MSNNLQTLVPILDGLNYRHWAELMKAYLQQQDIWIIVDLPNGIEEPTLVSDAGVKSLNGIAYRPRPWAAFTCA